MCEQVEDSISGPLQSGPFQYTALDSAQNEIRLLRILPRQNDYELAPVQCEIIHTSLDAFISYKALSYTWGSPQHPQYIIKLNGLSHLVRENLWLVLRQLQAISHPIVIWIDAVCINQTDTQERNEQVSKMKAIFERADEVIAWLGSSFGNSHLAFQLIRELYDHFDDVDWINQRLRQPQASEVLAAFSALLQRDYWSRMWIVQELAVAKQITLQCGVDSINARAVDEAQRLLTSISRREKGFDYDHIMILLPNDARGRAAVQFKGMTDVRELQEALTSRHVSFFECVLHNFLKGATDPRDMVYGLAALANTNDVYRINIDYSLSVNEVYIDLAKKELQTCKALNILTRARLGSNRHSLPSWVPDWSTNSDHHKYLYDIKVQEHTYSASGESRCNVSFTDCRNTLKLTAVVLGYVEGVSEVSLMENEDDLETAAHLVLGWWSLLKASGGHGLQYQEGFGRTLICNRVSDRNRGLWNKDEFGRLVLGAWIDLCCVDYSTNNIDPVLAEHYSYMQARDKDLEEEAGHEYKEDERRDVYRRWTQTSANFIWDRRFFLGSSNMMGLATEGVRIGDIICVPLGCPHPMIFQKVNDHYIVIGEAFVDGYMYGKAMEKLEMGELKLETFELH